MFSLYPDNYHEGNVSINLEASLWTYKYQSQLGNVNIQSEFSKLEMQLSS